MHPLELLLFRHGQAESLPASGGGDSARELTETGRSQLRRVALWLRERSLTPDLVLHSPYRRTTQTALILAEEFGLSESKVRQAPWMAPGAGPVAEPLMRQLRRTAVERIAAVGHQPEVGRTAMVLTGGSHIAFSPGSVACIRFDGVIQAGQGTLHWLLAASLFRAEG